MEEGTGTKTKTTGQNDKNTQRKASYEMRDKHKETLEKNGMRNVTGKAYNESVR